MSQLLHRFIRDDHGAVTVEWTVLSAAAVSMSLATVAVLNGGLQTMVSRIDAELREQQMGENFIGFTSAHFEPLYEQNLTTPEYAETLFNSASTMMNQDIINALEQGITAMEEGRLSQEDIVALMALASVARQRNIVDSQILDYYFGFDGATGQINNIL